MSPRFTSAFKSMAKIASVSHKAAEGKKMCLHSFLGQALRLLFQCKAVVAVASEGGGEGAIVEQELSWHRCDDNSESQPANVFAQARVFSFAGDQQLTKQVRRMEQPALLFLQQCPLQAHLETRSHEQHAACVAVSSEGVFYILSLYIYFKFLTCFYPVYRDRINRHN